MSIKIYYAIVFNLSRQSVVILGGKGKNVMLFDPKHVFQNKEQLTILSERFKTDIYGLVNGRTFFRN